MNFDKFTCIDYIMPLPKTRITLGSQATSPATNLATQLVMGHWFLCMLLHEGSRRRSHTLATDWLPSPVATPVATGYPYWRCCVVAYGAYYTRSPGSRRHTISSHHRALYAVLLYCSVVSYCLVVSYFIELTT